MEGLMGLADELLLKILLSAGAPAVARAATLCRRLRHAQQQLSALPAFASAAVLEEQEVEECVCSAVKEALAAMPATVDVCLLFVAGGASGRGRDAEPLAGLVPLCQTLLPPGALVVGCCGRGLFGVQGGAAVELDPSQARHKGASVLLGRLPGCQLRAFAARGPPAGGWASKEACRAWLGLGFLDPAPASCLLFAHGSAGGHVHNCVEAMGAALPQMVLTGGISSGVGELFCSQPLPQQAGEEGAAEGGASSLGTAPAAAGGSGRAQQRGGEAARPRYVGLLVCRQEAQPGAPGSCAGGGSRRVPRCAALTAQGLEGGEPRFTQLTVIREFGTLEHPNNHGQPEVTELVGVCGALSVQGDDATPLLHRLATHQMELALWAAERAAPGSYDGAVSAGRPVVVLQLYGVAEDAEALATANNEGTLAAVMADAEQPGRMLCAQPLRLSPEGARRALEAGVGQLAAALPSPHRLLPTHACGLVAVSCTAKGRQMFNAVGVEAGAIRAASAGLPLAGVYCDGEIGPAVLNAKSALRWAEGAGGSTANGSGSGGESSDGGGGTSQRGRSALQGFTTVVTALAGAN
ncbi:hypothetical protein ABPG75_011690 [Micractinium tetrahymenae]